MWLIYIVKADLDMSFAVFALPNGLLDLAGSFAAAYVVFRVCRFIEHHAPQPSKFMEWIGRNTLAIFCLHIVEDNAMGPVWHALEGLLGAALPHAGWLAFLAIRLAFIAAECAIVYCIPRLNGVYFPSKRPKPKAVAGPSAGAR